MSEKQDLRFYEQVLVLHPESKEQEHKEICRLTSQLVKQKGGEIFKLDTWGSRPIANPRAKKVSRGWYFYMLFSAPVDLVAELRSQFSINSKILYFHQEKLSKKETAENRIQKFLQVLEQSRTREKDRQTRLQKRQNWPGRP